MDFTGQEVSLSGGPKSVKKFKMAVKTIKERCFCSQLHCRVQACHCIALVSANANITDASWSQKDGK